MESLIECAEDLTQEQVVVCTAQYSILTWANSFPQTRLQMAERAGQRQGPVASDSRCDQ
jgi:hypothetical protein